ncbi:MAG TPA: serine hydrolase [Thermoanaerobaculia bacterium]|nr:serine hydrolase [Thermoanaerobaculia bacterium]
MKARLVVLALIMGVLTSCRTLSPHFEINYDTPTDPKLQHRLEEIDANVREKFAIPPGLTDVGVLDLHDHRLAMIHPDEMEYAASVAKVGILLAWFQKHPEAATQLDPQTRHELGLMIKLSSNEMATKFSRQLGIPQVQQVLNDYGFYDEDHGGGIWFGKHYGPNSDRIRDPIANQVHGVTVRQLIRFYYLLDQRKLVSPAASEKMREIFLSPDIPHDENKFVRGLAGRGLTILRKSGTYDEWFHDSALIEGPNRRYILVALTRHPCGDQYLEELAREVDDYLNPTVPLAASTSLAGS